MTNAIRIGSGLGFYGDNWEPVVASIERGQVQFIASDHLAELTLAILQKDRQRDPTLGYARDVLPMLLRLWPLQIWARMVLHTPSKAVADGFGRLFPWMALSGQA
ncbi:acyclic terpene utilization AtuA family protein [Limnohabitans sp. DM1]|uniref:acyclic terpene utilization AtuA family protein n=1 Tax=Limnohabitans sp. DM1 TaxID=1597955 RepID=UPI000A4B52BD|nr:acyclic terpene utilization AtuA family protein [Limnohabitans sp. DM1]